MNFIWYYIFERTWSTPLLFMLWLLASPGHQQQCYWSFKIKGPLSSTSNDFKYLRHFNVDKCKKMQIHFMFSWTQLLTLTLQWRHNGRDGISSVRCDGCLLNRLFGCRSKKTSKLRVTGLCVGNSPVTGEFPTQKASNTENVSIW